MIAKLRMRVICGLMAFLIFQEYAFAFQVGNIEIKLLGSSSETYDDNVSYVEDNPKSDYITSASLGMNAEYNSKLSTMSLSGNIRHQLFSKYSNFDNTSEDFTFNFLKELSRHSRISLRNSFVHAEEPRSFEDQFGDTSARYSYSRNRLSLGYTRDITKQLSLNLKFSNNKDDNSGASARDDSYMNKLETSLDYAMSSDLIIKGVYYYSKRKFKSGPSASNHVFSGGFRRYLTKQLYVDVQPGVAIISSFDKTRLVKPSFEASLNDEIDENSYARLSFSKKYEANGYSQNLFNSWRFSCDFVRQLFKRLSLYLSTFYGKGEYASTNTKNTLSGANAGLTYNIRENITANISYGYSKNTSNISANGFTKNTISLAITIEF